MISIKCKNRECETEFIPTHGSQLYCTKSCTKRENHLKDKDKYHRDEEYRKIISKRHQDRHKERYSTDKEYRENCVANQLRWRRNLKETNPLKYKKMFGYKPDSEFAKRKSREYHAQKEIFNSQSEEEQKESLDNYASELLKGMREGKIETPESRRPNLRDCPECGFKLIYKKGYFICPEGHYHIKAIDLYKNKSKKG